MATSDSDSIGGDEDGMKTLVVINILSVLPMMTKLVVTFCKSVSVVSMVCSHTQSVEGCNEVNELSQIV